MAYSGKIDDSQPQSPGTVPNVFLESQGWMVCDGRQLDISQFSSLYNAIGTIYNQKGDPSDKFRIPDYRGYFFRGTDLQGINDPDTSERLAPDQSAGKDVGSIQKDAFQVHQHNYSKPDNAGTPPPTLSAVEASEDFKDTPSGDPTGTNVKTSANETRPLNVYVHYLIKSLPI